MTRKQKRVLRRTIAAAALLIVAAIVCSDALALITNGTLGLLIRLALFLIPYGIIGYDILYRAGRGVIHGQMLDENFLMAVATVGALCLGEYAEAVFVMLFYQIGELFQSIAVGKSRRSIAALMDIRPEVAHVLRDGAICDVDPGEVAVDEIFVIHPGERIPLDGEVCEGESYLDTAALTGESVPRHVRVGDAVISGCVNTQAMLQARATHAYEDSTVARVLELVENSAARKSRSEAFITRFARVYTPAVVAGALLLAVVPSLITGQWAVWIERALTFLVVSCPCALVISVPLSFFGGIGGASRHGILFKGSGYLELLSRCDTVVFDKTGTLTKGTFRVTALTPANGVTQEELLSLCAQAEQFSDHPIARSIVAHYGAAPDATRVSNVCEVAGEGVTACCDGTTIAVGNLRLMARCGVQASLPDGADIAPGATVVYAAQGTRYLGAVVISDEIKADAAEAIAALKRSGVRRIALLTGDRAEAAGAVAAALDIDEVISECLPEDKVQHLERLIDECHRRRGARLAFVGDGINDAPVLTRADVGVAMGALGTDAAIEAADVVLMDDKPAGLALAMQLSRRTRRIVIQNVVFALGVKLAVLALGALGYASLWAAVFADVGVAVIAICNAMRNLR